MLWKVAWRSTTLRLGGIGSPGRRHSRSFRATADPGASLARPSGWTVGDAEPEFAHPDGEPVRARAAVTAQRIGHRDHTSVLGGADFLHIRQIQRRPGQTAPRGQDDQQLAPPPQEPARPVALDRERPTRSGPRPREHQLPVRRPAGAPSNAAGPTLPGTAPITVSTSSGSRLRTRVTHQPSPSSATRSIGTATPLSPADGPGPVPRPGLAITARLIPASAWFRGHPCAPQHLRNPDSKAAVAERMFQKQPICRASPIPEGPCTSCRTRQHHRLIEGRMATLLCRCAGEFELDYSTMFIKDDAADRDIEPPDASRWLCATEQQVSLSSATASRRPPPTGPPPERRRTGSRPAGSASGPPSAHPLARFDLGGPGLYSADRGASLKQQLLFAGSPGSPYWGATMSRTPCLGRHAPAPARAQSAPAKMA
ncbi:hypothetical protein A4R44_08833 [Amycolatopsis sp. M39]|nr:hypothetical protein A4R44_08833 [Amycolatopsis sp. M39]